MITNKQYAMSSVAMLQCLFEVCAQQLTDLMCAAMNVHVHTRLHGSLECSMFNVRNVLYDRIGRKNSDLFT